MKLKKFIVSLTFVLGMMLLSAITVSALEYNEKVPLTPTETEEDDDYYVLAEWNTDDAAGSWLLPPTEEEINGVNFLVDYGIYENAAKNNVLNGVSAQGDGYYKWASIGMNGGDAQYRCNVDALKKVDRRMYSVEKVRNLPISVCFFENGYTRSRYGGSFRFYQCNKSGYKLNGTNGSIGSGQLCGTVRFGYDMKDDNYKGCGTETFLTYDNTDVTDSVNVKVRYNKVLPKYKSEEVKISATGTTTRGVDAALARIIWKNNAKVSYQGYIKRISLDDKFNGLIDISHNGSDIKLTIKPEIYSVVGDAESLEIPVTIVCDTFTTSGEAVSGSKEITNTVTLKLDRPKVKIQFEGVANTDIPAEVFCRTSVSGTLSLADGGFPGEVYVYADNRSLEASEFEYDNTNGQLTIPANLVNDDVRITASEKKYYYVNTQLIGAGTIDGGNQSYAEGQTVWLKAEPEDNVHYVFKYWEDESGNRIYDNPYTIENIQSVHTYTAVIDRRTYKIVYDPNIPKNYPGELIGEMEPQTIIYDENSVCNLSVARYDLDNFSFQGWATEPDGAVIYGNREEVKQNWSYGEDVTLYAVWKLATGYSMWYNYEGDYLTCHSPGNCEVLFFVTRYEGKKLVYCEFKILELEDPYEAIVVERLNLESGLKAGDKIGFWAKPIVNEDSSKFLQIGKPLTRVYTIPEK